MWIENGRAYFGELTTTTAAERHEAEQWRASWERHVSTLPAAHLAEADACQKENDPHAEAYHLRQLLDRFAFADVGLAVRLRECEAQMRPREPAPPPRPVNR